METKLNDTESFAIGMLILAICVAGFVAGYNIGVSDARREAISNRQAHWEVNDNGHVFFVWGPKEITRPEKNSAPLKQINYQGIQP